LDGIPHTQLEAEATAQNIEHELLRENKSSTEEVSIRMQDNIFLRLTNKTIGTGRCGVRT